MKPHKNNDSINQNNIKTIPKIGIIRNNNAISQLIIIKITPVTIALTVIKKLFKLNILFNIF